MLSLSDDELRIVLDNAQPLAPEDRSKFLEAVAVELAKYRELGPGVVSRTCRELQKRHFAPPVFQGDRSKHSR
jgi:hypothetical protein